MKLIKSRKPKCDPFILRQLTYSVNLSKRRAFRLQNLLNIVHCDAILIITGVDSKFNSGSSELFSYLLFDVLNVRNEDIKKTGVDDSIFEDCVICIKSNVISVYCNPIGYYILAPYFVHWHNLELFCLPEDKYDDVDKSEEFKIRSFIQMVTGCDTIGIPYYTSNYDDGCSPRKFDKMMIEQWPLIQAYAVEENGGGGFFTLKHKVKDISIEVANVLKQVDCVALEDIFTKTLISFEMQCDNVLQLIDNGASISNLEHWRSTNFLEPLNSYLRHGATAADERYICDKELYCCVLFGNDTQSETLRSCMQKKLSSTFNTSNASVLHVIIQACSPKANLVVARTYFFHSSVFIADVNGKEQTTMMESRILQKAYITLIQTVNKVADTMLHGMSIDKAVQNGIAEIGVAMCDTVCKPEIRVLSVPHNECSTSIFGGDMDTLNDDSTVMYNICGRILDIIYDKCNLGSVVFSDTFVMSQIPCVNSNAETILDVQSLIATCHIPRFINWYGEKLSSLKSSGVATNYGDPICVELVQVVNTLDVYNPADMNCVFYEKYMILQHHRHGCCFLKVDKLHYYEGADETSGTSCSLLHIEVFVDECTNAEHILDGLLSAGNTLQTDVNKKVTNDSTTSVSCGTSTSLTNATLRILLPHKHKSKRVIFEKVLPIWKLQHMELNQVSSVTKEIKSSSVPQDNEDLKSIEILNLYNKSLRGGNKDSALWSGNLIFLKHLEAALCLRSGKVKLNVEEMKIIHEHAGIPYQKSEQIELQSQEHKSQLILTIICGSFGSFKEQLCQNLVKFVMEETKWLYYILENMDDVKSLFDKLNGALNQTSSVRRPTVGQSKKVLRALVCCPVGVGVWHIEQVIKGLPVTIGSCTVCIDVNNCFVDNRLTFPMILEQCSQGWANNVVLTNDTDCDTKYMLNLLQLVNPKLSIMHAAYGHITNTECINSIIYGEQFTHSANAVYRLLNPYNGVLLEFEKKCGIMRSPNVVMKYISIPKPLDRKLFIANLKELKASLSAWPYKNNIYCVQGQVNFTSDKIKLYEFYYTVLSNHLILNSIDIVPLPPCKPRVSITPEQRQDVIPGNARSSTWIRLWITVDSCEVNSNGDDTERFIKHWLNLCVPHKPAEKSLRLKNDVTLVEKEALKSKFRLSALPEGWYFNGTYYVSMDGEKSDLHPNMNKFIEDYIAEENRKIVEFNDNVSKASYPDLF